MKMTVHNSSEYKGFEPKLYMALELGDKRWKLAFSVGLGQRARLKTIVGGDMGALEREVRRAKRRFGLAETAPVVSCYEAGRDGFWIHRYLSKAGVRNYVVDSSSIEVNRKARRAKSDSLDARKLVEMLMRYELGEKRVWRVVRVPSGQDEDDRHLHRNLRTLKQDRTRGGNRIRGLLKTQGISWGESILKLSGAALEQLSDWEGQALEAGLKARIGIQLQLFERLCEVINGIEQERRQLLRHQSGEKLDQIRQLEALKGVGINSSWTLVMEAYGWRAFKNRRQVGGCLGLTPSPYHSGAMRREQGISKAGNVWCRQVLGEIAWTWIQYQPQSELALWFRQRFEHGGPVARKIGIVAVGRKLAIQLWQYLEFGVVPPGAQFYSSLQAI